ncbi:MAG: amino acid synthesis family protein [Desulfuromonadales bacterium]|nr:amino acid synthesis family protein [Desulfuromonadales bacterium]
MKEDNTLDTPRKVVITSETIDRENGRQVDPPITRVAGMFVIPNPFAGKFEEDLSPLFELGREVGEHFAPKLAELCNNAVVSYGKAVIVGTAGEIEHGAACMHPKLGKPMRAAIGGGEAIIASNVKVGPSGASIDVPLGNKDDAWSLDHCDSMTVSIPDAPRPDEMVIVIVFADGGRPFPRC